MLKYRVVTYHAIEESKLQTWAAFHCKGDAWSYAKSLANSIHHHKAWALDDHNVMVVYGKHRDYVAHWRDNCPHCDAAIAAMAQ